MKENYTKMYYKNRETSKVLTLKKKKKKTVAMQRIKNKKGINFLRNSSGSWKSLGRHLQEN